MDRPDEASEAAAGEGEFSAAVIAAVDPALIRYQGKSVAGGVS